MKVAARAESLAFAALVGFVGIAHAAPQRVQLIQPEADSDRAGYISGMAAQGEALHVSDSANNAVFRYADGEVGRFKLELGEGAFSSTELAGIARAGQSLLAVTDKDGGQVALVRPDGKRVTVFGGDGSDAGQLSYPTGVAASANNRIYVADRGNGRVSVFSQSGVFLRHIGASELERPESLGVNAAEHVFVLDTESDGRVLEFGPKGELVNSWSAEELASGGQLKLGALAVGPDNLVYVASTNRGRVYVLDREKGRLVAGFGTSGSGPGRFKDITALAGLSGGRVAVADAGNQKVEIYRVGVSGQPAERAWLPWVDTANDAASPCTRGPRVGSDAYLCIEPDKGAVVLRNQAGEALTRYSVSGMDDLRTATADERTVAVLHGEKLSIFSRAGELVTTLGGYGDGKGKFQEPVDVALGKERIYVADQSLEQVQVFSREGVFLRDIRDAEFGKNHLDDPTAVVADDQGTVYIADAGRADIAAFNRSGEFLYRLPGSKSDSEIAFTSVRDVAMDPDGQLYVLGGVEGTEARITVFNGPRVVFGFGSAKGGAGALTEPKRLNVGTWPGTAVHVEQEEGTAAFRYMQAPGRVTQVRVSGDTDRVRLEWAPVAGAYVTGYRIMSAPLDGGEFLQIGRSQEPAATFNRRAELARRYRVAAVSGFGRQGPASPVAEDRLGKALRALRDGDAGRAERLLRPLYEQRPDDPAVIEQLGRALLAQDAAQEAADLFARLVEVADEPAAAQRLRVEALVDAGAYNEAFQAAQKAIESGAAQGDTLVQCAQAALAMNDAIGAVECLDRLAEDSKAWAQGAFLLARARMKLGLKADAAAAVERGIEAAGGSARAHARAAQVLRELGRNEAAFRHFKQAVQGGMGESHVLLGYARTALDLERYDRANNIASKLTSDSATEPQGRYIRGLVAQANNDHSRALIELRRATRADGDFVDAWLALASTYKAMDRGEERLNALKSAWQADQDAYEAAVRYGRALRGAKQFDAAVEPLTRAHRARPKKAKVALDLADSLLRADKLQRARTAADAAVKAAGEPKVKDDARVVLAEVNRRLGRTTRALELVQNVLKRRPDDVGLHIKLGRIYLATNVYSRAKSALEQAKTLAPKNAVVRRLLGDLYLAQRVFDKAIPAYEKAVDLEPSKRNRSALEKAFAEKKQAREFGENRPQVVLRKLKLDAVFAAAYKKYKNESIGSVVVENVGQSDYSNLKLTFRVKGYMDFPTQHKIDTLAAGEKRRISLTAAFNNKMLQIDEDKGVQSEVALKYTVGGKSDSIRLTQPLTVYGKNAILWGKEGLVGAFVTPRDDVVRNFVRRTMNEYRPQPGPLNEPVVTAMTLYNALSAYGMEYVVDPNSPFSEVQDDRVDYLQYPRETLRLKTGDCDDLSTLLAAGLQNLGIETAMVEIPGHLFMMFNTGLPASKRGKVSADPGLTVIRGGKVWIPVEATLISESFSEAWAEGAAKFNNHEGSDKLNVVALKQAWKQYEPVSLPPADFDVAIPDNSAVQALVERERELLLEKSLQRLTRPYRTILAANPDNRRAQLQIAILQGRYGLYEEALKGFSEVLEDHPGDSAALNNRGNVFLKKGKLDKAIQAYRQAEQQAPNDAGIKVNLAMAHYQAGDLEGARKKLAEAKRIDPEVAKRNERLVNLVAK